MTKAPQVLAGADRAPSQAGPLPVRAGFWRRLAAAWVDLLLLYAVASFAIGLAALVNLRVALEPAILTLGFIYGVGCTGCFDGRTVGKVLWGVAVARERGENLTWLQTFLREGLAKWLILGALPLIAGRLAFGAAWVPTGYDLPAVLPLLVLTLIYYALLRRAWYDQLMGTTVLRRPAPAPATSGAFALLLGVGVVGASTKLIERMSLGTLPSRTLLYYGMGSTRPFQEFLKGAAVSPNDYIFGLFNRYDVVVLCERAHSEATQWDFIFDLVKDPRFNERVGHVYTELGQVGMQARLDELMASDGLSDAEVNERVLEIMRHWSVWPRWHRVNFPTYLKRLYALNQALPPGKRIRHHLTDVPVDWLNLTKDKMPDHWRALGRRDERMAQVILDEIERREAAGVKPVKGLVVMNFRHAFDLTGGFSQAARYNTCEFLRDGLPHRVANVQINEDFLWPAAGGLWNQAFARNGNRPAGFNFAGSPFGREPFDLFPWSPSVRARLRYQDVFTGFVFVNPVSAHHGLEGIPGYYRGWENEMRRRAKLFGEDWVKTIDREIALEQQGRVPVRSAPLAGTIESWVGLVMGSFFAAGLGLGFAGFGFRRRVQAPVVAAARRPPAPVPSQGVRAARTPRRAWLAFAGAIVLSLYVHEVGHCLVSWLYGCPAIPTPAKEYVLRPLPAGAQNAVALGGMLGSVLALFGAAYWFLRKPGLMRSALLAGAMTLPGFYLVRFLLAGRGHDGTEFQEAQAALGLSYPGHALDWLFAGLFVLAAAAWFWRTRPPLSLRVVGRLVFGSVLGLLILAALQVGNNALFDPWFGR